MCKKASRTFFFFKSHLCHMDRNTFRLKKTINNSVGKEKKTLSVQTFIHINMERSRAANRYTYTQELVQLYLFGELTSFPPYSFPPCRYWDKMKLQRDFYYHHFLPCTLHFRTVQGSGFFRSVSFFFLAHLSKDNNILFCISTAIPWWFVNDVGFAVKDWKDKKLASCFPH